MKNENPAKSGIQTGTAVFIRSATIGRGDDELGANLMMNFLHQLSKAESTPDTLIMMNAGVKLVVEGSEVLDELDQLQQKGVTILVCGTCLNYFEIADKLKVGKMSNMVEITAALLGATKVVTV